MCDRTCTLLYVQSHVYCAVQIAVALEVHRCSCKCVMAPLAGSSASSARRATTAAQIAGSSVSKLATSECILSRSTRSLLRRCASASGDHSPATTFSWSSSASTRSFASRFSTGVRCPPCCCFQGLPVLPRPAGTSRASATSRACRYSQGLPVLPGPASTPRACRYFQGLPVLPGPAGTPRACWYLQNPLVLRGSVDTPMTR